MQKRYLTRVWAPLVLSLVVASAIFFSLRAHRKSRQDAAGQRQVNVVSWGGQFQQDLMQNWLLPAARQRGIAVRAASWDGDYGTLTTRIENGLNNWDLVHVEAHYVETPRHENLFEPIDRVLPLLASPELAKDRAVPVLEYGYVLASRSDKLDLPRPLRWRDFFDTRIVQRRGARDFPIGNIEIALLSRGYDLKTALYRSDLSRIALERIIDEALSQWSRIADKIVWWKLGDDLQRDLTSGTTPLSAAWSGRVLAAHKQLCPDKPIGQCQLQANLDEQLISTDWWVIPAGAVHASEARDLLLQMYTGDASESGAEVFAQKQGYSVPLLGFKVADPTANQYLQSSRTRPQSTRMNEAFWGSNFDWVYSRWKYWRQSH
jgi:putative spermidine/putrescine transport system substrate-binding protein